MRKMILAFVLTCWTGGMTAAPSVKELRDQTWQLLQAVEQKQQTLRAKMYTGTWADVLTSRVADVNEVAATIRQTRLSAKDLLAVSGSRTTVREAIDSVIAEKSKQSQIEQKQSNGEFLRAVSDILADPNRVPDPNEIEDSSRIADFMTACLDVVVSHGGI